MKSFTFRDIVLDKSQSLIVKKFFSQKKMIHLWEYIDSLNVSSSIDKELEVICGKNSVTVRLWN